MQGTVTAVPFKGRRCAGQQLHGVAAVLAGQRRCIPARRRKQSIAGYGGAVVSRGHNEAVVCPPPSAPRRPRRYRWPGHGFPQRTGSAMRCPADARNGVGGVHQSILHKGVQGRIAQHQAVIHDNGGGMAHAHQDSWILSPKEMSLPAGPASLALGQGGQLGENVPEQVAVAELQNGHSPREGPVGVVALGEVHDHAAVYGVLAAGDGHGFAPQHAVVHGGYAEAPG